MALKLSAHPASFRDSDGFVAVSEPGEIYRIVTPAYDKHYQKLITSGLYETLVSKRFLVTHEVVSEIAEEWDNCRVLKPEHIPFITYPYEWSFRQLKDAALLTLDIQLLAIEHGLTLKDASAYNVQFLNGSPIFIDTSSFKEIEKFTPWGAYGQFCRHFLAPLSLMAFTDVNLNKLSVNYIDGIPLDLCVKLLPWKTRIKLGLFTHLFMHSKSINNSSNQNSKSTPQEIGKNGLIGIIKHLRSTVAGLNEHKQKTTWDDYYISNNNYTSVAFAEKENWIKLQLKGALTPNSMVWDLGANDGYFSKLAAEYASLVVAMDIDPNAVNRLYQQLKSTDQTAANSTKILPLVVDLATPTPAIGWANQERTTLWERGKPDLIMALALIHHLVIGNNLSFQKVASFLAAQTREYLIIEFVGVEDSQVTKLTQHRELDSWKHYTPSNFEKAFGEEFNLISTYQIPESLRKLYVFKRK